MPNCVLTSITINIFSRFFKFETIYQFPDIYFFSSEYQGMSRENKT